MKYYAVRQGRRPGIYHSWDECYQQVHGYKGAIYKKFESEEEALQFMDRVDRTEEYDLTDLDDKLMVAYVDGSYNSKTAVFGYGVVLFSRAGKEVFKGSLEGDYAQHRNVAGEVFGAREAMRIALERKMKKLVIHYDYAGIRHWALGEWKANKDLTIAYRDYADQVRKSLDLEFVKIAAHTGVQFNEEADRLAKEACGLVDS